MRKTPGIWSKRFLTFALAILFCEAALLAQSVRVRGTVVDQEGGVVIGAVVLVAGTDIASVTDAQGQYSIEARKNDILVFSSLGYEEVRESINSRDCIDITMRTSSISLNDAVVIGYGTQKKADLTGSLSVINSDDINSPAFISADQALQGRVSGVDIVSGGGEPGAESSIRIRGTRSITAGNDPLIVVDGIIGAVENFSDINPDDIKTISILKDASSTAIYGARGANGVILITTKGGDTSRLKIQFSTSLGLSELPKKLDVMDASEFARWRNDYKYPSVAFDDPDSLGKGTDWQEVLTQKAFFQNYRLQFGQGTRQQHFWASVAYDNKPGIVIGTGMRRVTSVLKVDRQVFKWMTVGAKINYTWQHNDVNKISINGNSSLAAVSLSPLIGPEDIWNRYSDGAESSSSVYNSPYLVAKLETNYRTSHFLNLAPWVEIKPFKGAAIRSTYSYSIRDLSQWYYSPSTLPVAASRNKGGTAIYSDTRKITHLSETTFSYKKTFASRQVIDALIGFTAEHSRRDYNYTKGVGYADDNVGPYSLGSVVDKRNLTVDSDVSEITRMSVLARATYSYKSRYYATLTARADGSSNFSAGNKWAFFPAAALKWAISNEPWMRQAKGRGLTNLALRLSAGINGNDAISSYVSLPVITSATGTWLFGDNPQLIAYPSRLGDPSLTWEKTRSLNAGLDISILNDRVAITVDGYLSQTDDLLLQVQNASHTGFTNRYANVGKTKGWGAEFSLESRNILKQHFSWKTCFTASHASSMITDIGADFEYVPTFNRGTQMLFGYKKGYPVNALWGYQFCGVWQTDDQITENNITHAYASNSYTKGYSKYADVNHDGILDDKDMIYLGSSDPILHGGLQNTFNIYNFELGVFLTWSLGGKIYNISEIKLGTPDTSANKYTYLYKNAWHAERNPEGTLPSAKASGDSFASDRFVHDSSFLRLKTLSISYRFDLSHHIKWLQDVLIGAYFDNLLLLTGYNGFDPDVSSSRSVARLDNASYPNPRSYMLSIRIRY